MGNKKILVGWLGYGPRIPLKPMQFSESKQKLFYTILSGIKENFL